MKRILLLIPLVALVLTTVLSADGVSRDEKKKQLIKDHLMFNSAQGREFFIAVPPNEVENYSANVLELYITAGKKTTVTMESPTTGVYLTKNVEPLKITTFSSNDGETSFQWEVRESEMIIDKGVRLFSDQPLSVYVLNAKVYTSDGYLAIPTSAWGTEYYHCSYYDFLEVGPWASGFIVIAAHEQTKIKIELKGRGKEYATTFAGRRIGEQINQTIHPGQVYMVRGDATTRGIFDMTGSRITANKPIGLISFHMRTIIPSYSINNGRDHLSEMLPPVQAWGKEYVTIEYKRDKGRGDFFRVVASQPNTKFKCVYYDLNDDKVLGNWEQPLYNAGDFAEYMEVDVTAGHDLKSIRGASVWKSDKPVLVMQYSYSEQWDGATVFDPFMILVVPREQYIPTTVFQTPANKAFVTNWFNIIAVGDTTDTEQKKLQSITIDGKPLHVLEPTFLYNRIPTTDLYWAKTPMQVGAHLVKGDTKFGGYIYGFSNWDSYGWPAAMAINKLDETDTLEPVLEYTSECGTYYYKATELRNGKDGDDPKQVDQGISDVQLLSGSYNYDLILEPKLVAWPPLYIYDGIKLVVMNKYQPGFALFTVIDRAGNVALDSVRYEPDSLELIPKVISFGDVRVATSKQITAKLKNISDSAVTIIKVELASGKFYKILAGQAPPEYPILSGEIKDIVVEYTPQEERLNDRDLDYDTLLVETKCLKFRFPIDGSGVMPRILVENWDAGAVPVGKTVCKSQQTGGLKIENPGTMPLVITGATGVVAPFSITDPTNPPFPILIEPKGTIFLKDICFEALDTKSYSIDVTFHSNADKVGSDSVSNWMGRGLLPGPYITSKDWERRRVKTVHDSVVVLRNAGNDFVYVTDVVLETNDPNFRINKSGISPGLPFNLAPDTSSTASIKEIIIPVTFEPVDEGQKSVKIIPQFQDPNIPAGSVYGTLQGFGFLPKIEVKGYEFIPEILVNTVHPTIGIVEILSTSTTSDLYVESVKWSPSSQHPNDFAWDASQNPVLNDFVIPIGQSVKLPVIFSPKDVRERIATVDVISDAAPGPNLDPRVTTSADVKGNAYETGIVVDSINYGAVLLCDEPILNFTVENLSSTTPVNISKFEWIGGDMNVFELLEQPPRVILERGEYKFPVRFKPGVVGNFAALLKVVSDFGDSFVLIEGSTYTVPVNFSLPVLTDMAPGMRTIEPPYKDFHVIVESGYWGFAEITNFTIELKYKNSWMSWGQTAGSQIRKGNVLDNSWNVTGVETKDVVTGITTLTITGSGTNPIVKNGPLVFPEFILLLSDTAKFQPYYGAISVGSRDKCVTTPNKPGEIQLATCVQDLRNVIFSKNRFYLQSIEPNPVGDEGFSVKYGVAFEGDTRIELVNSNGEVVKLINDGITQAGNYEQHVQTSDIGSGIYFLRMTSSTFTNTSRVVIAK